MDKGDLTGLVGGHNGFYAGRGGATGGTLEVAVVDDDDGGVWVAKDVVADVAVALVGGDWAIEVEVGIIDC